MMSNLSKLACTDAVSSDGLLTNELPKRATFPDYSSLSAAAQFTEDAFDIHSAQHLDRSFVQRTWRPKSYERFAELDLFVPPFRFEAFLPEELSALRNGGVLTTIGDAVAARIRGETVLDLACGRNDSALEVWSRVFEAKKFVGVDLEALARGTKHTGFESAYVNSDILVFTSRLADSSVGFISLLGLEGHQTGAHKYAAALGSELGRVLKPGGMLLLDDLSYGLVSPEGYGLCKSFPTDEWYRQGGEESLSKRDQPIFDRGYASTLRLFSKPG